MTFFALQIIKWFSSIISTNAPHDFERNHNRPFGKRNTTFNSPIRWFECLTVVETGLNSHITPKSDETNFYLAIFSYILFFFFHYPFFPFLIYRIWCILFFVFSFHWNLECIHKAKFYSINIVLFYFINGHKVLTRRLISFGFKSIFQLSFKHSCHINSWLFPFDSAKPNRIGLSVTSYYKIESIKKGITWGIMIPNERKEWKNGKSDPFY